MRELSLFTGAGGGLLASKLLGWRTVGCVEHDDYRCRVLEQRQRDGMLDACPIYQMDIRDFNARVAPLYRGVADIVTAGFPCQVDSSAARGNNTARDCWDDTAECVRIVRPRFVMLENVTGLLARGRGAPRVFGSLAALGYDAQWGCISAAEAGAPHPRARVWIVARDADSHSEPGRPVDAEMARVSSLGWPDFPDDVGMGDGVASRMERFAAVGDGQVPRVAALAWRVLSAALAPEGEES